MMEEKCSLCDEPTGRAGKADDSIYYAYGTPAEIGPLCETCDNTLSDGFTEALRAENADLRAERDSASARVDAWADKCTMAELRADRFRAENADLVARVGELEQTLKVIAGDTIEYGHLGYGEPTASTLAAKATLSLPTPSALSRLRDAIYEECAGIAEENCQEEECGGFIAAAIRARKSR